MSLSDVVNKVVHNGFYKIILSFLVVVICTVCADADARTKRKRAVQQNYDITASPKYASLVVNASTGEVLHKQNADKILHPASLTKMMTIYKALEAVQNHKITLNTKIPVSRWASSQIPTKLGLKPGQHITVRDAIYGMIVHSANDAAVVMAEALAGSEDAFAVQMTRTAHKLGMKDTNFMNASGLHKTDQVTTAFDMAKLGIALRRDFPEYYTMFSKKSFIFNGAVINGHNRVMARYRWADGLKTGFTNASGFNIVSSATRPEGRIIAVVMGGYNASARDTHAISLLDKGFTKMTNGKYTPDERHYTSAQSTHLDAADPFDLASVDEDVYTMSDEQGSSTSAFASVGDMGEQEQLNATLSSLPALSSANLAERAPQAPVKVSANKSSHAISSRKTKVTKVAASTKSKVRMQASAPKESMKDLRKKRDNSQMSKAEKDKKKKDQQKKAQDMRRNKSKYAKDSKKGNLR